VLKFLVVGVTAYGMATFEGPMMSLKSVNALTHYTDYIIGHVHLGALAWNGGLAFAMLYYIVPRIYGTRLYSNRLANVHFWLATLGILFYAIPMYVAGITQSLMWQDFTPDGTLRYPNFLETVVRLRQGVMRHGQVRRGLDRRLGAVAATAWESRVDRIVAVAAAGKLTRRILVGRDGCANTTDEVCRGFL
jgi:cbb3-type cytochrome oxidase subunit 1